MNIRTFVCAIALLSSFLVGSSCGRNASAPKITLSTEKLVWKGHVDLKGEGFTPKTSVHSHLLRPNGTEFPVLPILTDDQGKFDHDIDTLLLMVGTHEVWVVDLNGVTSNRAKFEVTLAQ